MSSDFQGEDVVGKINFTGGFPTSKDFAPSIVFLVAYTITLPVLFMRWYLKSDRSLMLLRPTIFVGTRLSALVMRIIMSKKGYGLNEIIAELVLISIGYIFLIDPFIQCWKRNIEGNVPVSRRPHWLKPLRIILSILLIACVIVTIAAGAVTSDAFKSSTWLNVVQGLRETSYVLTLLILVFLATTTIVTHFHFKLPVIKTAYIVIPICCLFIVAMYRIIHGHTDNPNAPIKSLAAFWVLQMLFEYIAYIFVIAVSLPKFFPIERTSSEIEDEINRYHQDKSSPRSGNLSEIRSDDQVGREKWYDRLYVVKGVKWVIRRGRRNGANSQV